MKQLTAQGQQIINNIAQRTGFSSDAVLSLLQSVINGNGSMAQFSHSEFGGSGQWMRGGMIMLGDMFNNNLKNRVGNLCQELAELIASQPNLFQIESIAAQQQNNWWPTGLQFPTSTGSQNSMRYAYFATIHRLAIDINGQVSLYDTLNHHIGGFSQQQSGSSSVTFTSQYGVVDVTSLPLISVNNVPVQTPHLNQNPVQAQPSSGAMTQEADIFAAISKLAELKDKGILTDAEYSSKKAELLARL
jgi:hypothetical protein